MFIYALIDLIYTLIKLIQVHVKLLWIALMLTLITHHRKYLNQQNTSDCFMTQYTCEVMQEIALETRP